MSFVNSFGEKCRPVTAMQRLKLSREEVMRTQDKHIVQMHKSGISWRTIGKYLNRSHTQVRRRYLEIPEDDREYYANSATLA